VPKQRPHPDGFVFASLTSGSRKDARPIAGG
jgi:hypothetical protein